MKNLFKYFAIIDLCKRCISGNVKYSCSSSLYRSEIQDWNITLTTEKLVKDSHLNKQNSVIDCTKQVLRSSILGTFYFRHMLNLE